MRYLKRIGVALTAPGSAERTTKTGSKVEVKVHRCRDITYIEDNGS
jgi:hypothetical protein